MNLGFLRTSVFLVIALFITACGNPFVRPADSQTLEFVVDLGSTSGSRGFSNTLDFIGKDLKIDLYESDEGALGTLVSTQKVKIIEKAGAVVAELRFVNLPNQKSYILVGEIVDGTTVHYTGTSAAFEIGASLVPLSLSVKDYAANELAFTSFSILKADNPLLTQDYFGVISQADKAVRIPSDMNLGSPKIRFISTAAEVKLSSTNLISRDSTLTLNLGNVMTLTLVSPSGATTNWSVEAVQNLSLTGADATSVETAEFSAFRATDGDPLTRWASSNVGGTFPSPESLTVYLPSTPVFNLIKVDIAWEASATTFRVYTSTDNVNWTSVENTSGQTLTYTGTAIGTTQSLVFDSNTIVAPGNFLKIESDGTLGTGGVSIWEVLVWAY